MGGTGYCAGAFQSHYGAIATFLSVWRIPYIYGFQSHYGAIATYVSMSSSSHLGHFQSHYGAIATKRGAGGHDCLFKAFNPTMVRLQLHVLRDVGYEVGDFQSHYGAIATPLTHALNKSSPTFNPTMVRLQRKNFSYPIAQKYSFNPTMVRLQLCRTTLIASPCFPFNPTMVRLQPDTLCLDNLRPLHFQSHYGAIATAVPIYPAKAADKLSIPLWCDCNHTKSFCAKLYKFSFNPTMVRLQHEKFLRKAIQVFFQSHYGAIATRTGAAAC